MSAANNALQSVFLPTARNEAITAIIEAQYRS